MYHQYFGLNEAPFSIAVNPRYLFMSARHRDALAHLLYGVGAGGGFILLTGEVGTGKTTINRCLLEQLPHDTDIAIILNPALNAMELLATACDEFGITYDPDNHTLKTLTDKLHQYLLANHAAGRKTVLLIDEAQHLDFDVLEQIRLLTNLETNSEKLLQIILIGQPELAQLLARPELRQLNQRITARYNLEPLNLAETGAYIHHRLQVAGMTPDREIFPPAVVRGIYRHTRGIPRLINVLCDRILLGAYGRNKSRADRAMLRLAVQEVMGEEGAPDRRGWYLAGAAAAVLVLVAGWWYLQPSSAPAPEPPVAEQPAAEELPRAQEQLQPQPQIQPEVAPPPVAPAVVETAASVPAAEAEPQPQQDSYLLPPVQGMSQLWRLASDDAEPASPCDGDIHVGIACIEAQAATWDELEGLDRPLLLDMVTPERFAAALLLLGVEGRNAWVLSGTELRQVDLATLGPLWSGGYRFLWRPPRGYERPLSRGDSDPAVAEVAALFARLDGQQRPLADERFNQQLDQRVRMFQRSMGLEDDGVVGVQTLLALNRAVGVDASAAQARRQLAALAPPPASAR